MEKMNSPVCRFIDSNYNDLFQVPDGGKVIITYPNGEKKSMKCKHLDEYHTEIGGRCFHICEFAECMEALGAKYAAAPIKNKEMER